jgi:hypothetical protein
MHPEDSRTSPARGPRHPGPWPELLHPTPSAPFAGVRSYLDVPYAVAPGFRPLVLDLHLPDDGRRAARPVVVYAHGGGFFTGTKAMGPWRFLLDAGYAVASVAYRLSRQSRFPGPVHDVAAAVRWVRANAETYGLDANRVVGFGSQRGRLSRRRRRSGGRRRVARGAARAPRGDLMHAGGGDRPLRAHRLSAPGRRRARRRRRGVERPGVVGRALSRPRSL